MPKPRPGYDQHVPLEQLAGEGHVVLDGGLGEEVEGALGLDGVVAHLHQGGVQEVTLVLVVVGVDADALKVANYVLHEGWGVDESQGAVAEAEPVRPVLPCPGGWG